MILLVGNGNVGSHLAKHFSHLNIAFQQVNGRTLNVSDWQTSSFELIILAVKDDAIATLAEKLSVLNVPIVHTSGATPTTVFAGTIEQYGSFYPLQSFSKAQAVDWQEVPICIEANTEHLYQLLHQLAQQCSPLVRRVSDEQRATLHVAAVFANNFTNYMYRIAADICTQQDLDFDLLKPLIRQSAEKIRFAQPKDVQTGPAKRGDTLTIERHLGIIEANFPEYKSIYTLLTKEILDNNSE